VIEALLLDFDGLLYDTEGAVYGAWNALYARHGQELEIDLWVRESIGRPPGTSNFDPVLALQALVGRELDVEALRAEGEAVKRAQLPDRLMPGADALLSAARARGIRTAIVTSNHSTNVRRHLARAHTTFAFDALVSAEGDRDRGKPRPTLYLEALQVLGVAPERAVAFEDSPTGIAAAKAAGLLCVAVPNALTRGRPGVEAADLVLDSLEQVDLDRLSAGTYTAVASGDGRRRQSARAR
jgi:HAD superfamily hydrolase (TIGR01509 family)